MLIALLLPAFAAVPQDGWARNEEIVARFYCTPDAVEVGEPFELVLEYSHPADVSVFNAIAGELELDSSWVILDEERFPAQPDLDDAERKRTRRRWRIASLQPSDIAPRVLSPELSRLAFREDVKSIETSLARIQVMSLLGEEDVPRALAAFPEEFGREVPLLERSPLVAVVGGAVALFWSIFLYLLIRARRRPKGATVPELVPLEALARLRLDVGREPAAMREKHYALTRLLRRSFSKVLGESHAGLTDREWLAAVRGSSRVSAASVEEVAKLIDGAERIKYAGVVPSDWALQDTLASAQLALEGLSVTPATASGGDS
ncbi:MAG: hypothetical protein CMJ89_10690 [Planctomycetes bacterium]|nr:hypothetical protein [Planctomycetota bacterium]